jgi:hypothetical protein
MIYGLTIFLSAFLLFQVQLISAKRLLPWFGGAPAVWTTCEVFFQVVLLAGYAYVHLISRYCRPRRQAAIHLSLLLAALAVLAFSAAFGGVPLLAPAALKPLGTEQPIPLLLLTLFATVGLPFFALSATGPLLQSWHSRSAAPLDQTYRLYALSNVGSLLGLLTYPFLVERLFDLTFQAWGWTALFTLFVVGCGLVAWGSRDLPAPENHRVTRAEPKDETASEGTPKREALRPWLWLLLSFTSSALFLATTNQLSQGVAVVPFLWVLPLAVYLVTFIVCFDRPAWYSRRWFVAGSMAATLLVMLKPTGATIPVLVQVVGYGAFLAFFCMVCHGELVRIRPRADKLTLYYLLIAAGGALGGTFVSLAAPLVFSGLWELYITVLVGWLVVALVWFTDKTSPLWEGGRPFFGLSVAVASVALMPFLLVGTPLRRVGWVVHNPWTVVVGGAGALTLAGCVWAWRSRWAARPVWPQALVVLTLGITVGLLFHRVGEARAGTVFAARNFFGLVRVVALKDHLTDETAAYKLVHGVTDHGIQFTVPKWRDFPTSYYSPLSGIGVAARALEARAGRLGGVDTHLNIGVLGLGVGTIAAYAHRGDRVKFYEIDPIVIGIASKGSPYFSFLGDCAGSVSIVPGDARLSLERELLSGGSEKYDLLAVDCFSGDAIPVHLLTAEAFRVYGAHLRNADSIMAIHISNGYLDLQPVVAAGARELGYKAVRIETFGTNSELADPSTWVLLARNPAIFREAAFAEAHPEDLPSREIPFTDQYSNLFRVLR